MATVLDFLVFPWGYAWRAWSSQEGAEVLAVILWTGLGLHLLLSVFPKPFKLRASLTLLLTYIGMVAVASAGVALRGVGALQSDLLVFITLASIVLIVALYIAVSQKAWRRGLLVGVLFVPHGALMLLSANDQFWPEAMRVAQL